jgi:hypothetical protein
MGTFNLKRTNEIIEKLILILTLFQNKEERFNRFYMECFWFKQNIDEKKLHLPLETIQGYYLSYVLIDDVFSDIPEIQNLAEELSEVIQDIDTENF